VIRIFMVVRRGWVIIRPPNARDLHLTLRHALTFARSRRTMLLKVGELAQRTGLSVRTLHHYDAIGLLSPSQRTESGARLYGRDDLIRLHRIEALKRLACSLPQIQAALQASVGAPVETLQRQIDALRVEAARAQQLGQRLQRLLDVVAAGNETAASDWLDILELMNMYHKHMSDDEVGTLLD